MENIIRLATQNDAAGIAEIYASFCTESAISFEVVAPSELEVANRILSLTEIYPWLVCEREGAIQGYVYASKHRERAAYRWSTDVAVYMYPDSREQGIGKTLYSVLFKLLRQQGFFKAYAGITLPNPGSVALHEKTGFRPVGTYHGVGFKSGAWHDVSWWELSLKPETVNPPEPAPISAMIKAESCMKAIALGEEFLNRNMANKQSKTGA